MPDSFPSSVGSYITSIEAADMIADWVTLQGTMSITVNEANPKAHAFGSEKIQAVLDQSGCAGIRCYNGYYESKRRLIIVGVDGNGDDMTGGYIVELSRPCPPDCGTNPLA
ncbi:MAG: hypothetical protein V9E90_13980 [Saprospiraceae bacterium]|jgi:hypothetical protein